MGSIHNKLQNNINSFKYKGDLVDGKRNGKGNLKYLLRIN